MTKGEALKIQEHEKEDPSTITDDELSNVSNLADAYVEKPRLNPEAIGKSLLDRMPEPTGWRILLLPYQVKKKPLAEFFCLMRFKSEAKYLLR